MRFVNDFRVRLLVRACVVVLLLVGASAFGGTIYVEEGASGAGSSWGDAYGSLQDALDGAGSGDEIWVAAGTYKPSVEVGGTGDRYKTFQLINGVAIYGGFPSGGDTFANRDPNQYETILSGDIGVADDSNDNCCHVFYHPDGANLDATAILDGFTITAGNVDVDGGGMFNYASSPTVSNCTFSGNSAGNRGGGMFNYEESSPAVTDCTFSGNSADNRGGGMYNLYSSPTVTNCTFSGNSADDGGGGMGNGYSSPIVTNCTFSGNSAGSRGGGMDNRESSPIVTNCILWGDTAPNGNEIYNETSTPVISYCDIQGGWPGLGNIDVDPLFVDAAGGDLHLMGASPCINAGNNSAPSLGVTDFEGDPRIMNGVVDMGADEVTGDVLFSLNVTMQPFAWADTVTFDPAGGVYLPGTEVTITVGAAEGYLFDHWSGDLSGNDNPAMITMDSHKYVTAYFAFDGDIIYVDADATGLNNGTSWDDAFTDLQDGLAVADDPAQIWVAAGTYYPDPNGLGIGGRSKHFRMKNGVAIYGGFDGTETALDQRDAGNNETILSGDIGVADDSSDNCYHVFYHPGGISLDATAILDSFTITAGNADGSGDHEGGGMFNKFSSPTVSNCTFSGNSAGSSGGGMCNVDSSPTVIDCTFTGNEGGGDWFSGGGGGMYNYDSRPTVTGCTFNGNSADYGGGMSNRYFSDLLVTNCTFSGNSADHSGGGMYNWASSPTVTNCSFSGNSAASGGGMNNDPFYDDVCTFGSNPTVTNCTFGGNSANGTFPYGRGGGMYNNDNGDYMFSKNNNPIVTNCILWANTATNGNEIYNSSSTPRVSYCDIQGGYSGTGNINADPLFVDAAGGDFHLQGTSLCINAGNNSAPSLGVTDFEGDPRIIYGIVDMGADEVAGDVLFSLNITIQPFAGAGTVTLDPAGGMYLPGTEVSITVDATEGFIFDNWSGDLTGNDNPATITMDSHKYVAAHFAFDGDIIYVDTDATGFNNGTSWDDAFTDLQDGLGVALIGDEIWVAEGTYYPSVEVGGTGDRYKTFQMRNGVSIYGGFPAGGDIFANRAPNTYETILSGDIGVADEANDNCYHIFYHPTGTNLDAIAVLDGFTITEGNADGSGDHDSGGGMFNYTSSPTVSNCTFSGNSAGDEGGGMYNNYSSPTVSNCTFSGNSASDDGGGMSNWFSSLTVTNCTFSGNSSGHRGGGMYNWESSPIVTNCILWGDTAANGNEIYNFSSTPVISYCDIQGGYAGTGNIDADPLFVDAAGGDFHLQEASPCTNAGTNSAPSLGATDFEGDPRIMDGIVDMGIDEVAGDLLFLLDVTIKPFAGAGTVAFDPAGGVYPPGTEVSITIDAAEGFIFDGWSGDLSGNDNPATIIMDSHKYVTAHFNVNSDVIYVDANAIGLNNGASWDDALTDLQDALIIAGDPNQIWVAAGTYYPDPDGLADPREATFQLLNGVTIKGGYAGYDAADPNERNIELYETILSGDIGVADEANDNCYHVFYHPDGTNLNATALLDGFTITAGNADGSGEHVDGGGMANYSSSPTVSNCTFIGNSAGNRGGGMFNYEESSPAVTNCTFSGNSADNRGGGMYNRENSSPTITNCTFSGNSAYYGGGMYNDNSSPTVTNCTFSVNLAYYGGGMYNRGNNSPTVTNCTFTGNRVGYDGGGGMYNRSNNPTVSNCVFSGNSADYYGDGGGMYNYYNSRPTVSNCIFSGNSADGGGGGMYNIYSSNPTVTNCTFSGNQSGGMYNYYSSSPTVTNCIFSSNSAYSGGGMRNYNSSPTITNCTFAGNIAENGNGLACDSFRQLYPSAIEMINCIVWDGDSGIWNNDGSTITITYSDVQGGWPGLGNIDADPLFVDPNGVDEMSGTEDDNLRLMSGSPCIDAGDNGAVAGGITSDLNGFDRFIDDVCAADTGNGAAPVVDMGAYEFLRSDIDSNGGVDLIDFGWFAWYWQEIACGACGGCDLTCDGDVNWDDLMEFIDNWLEGVTP